MNEDAWKSLLALASSIGIGLRQRRYEGDVADLVAGGRTDFAPAVAITMYFDGPRDGFADGVVACWEEFLQRFGSRLTWYADEENGRWRTASSKELRRPSKRLRTSRAMPFYAWKAVSGQQYEDASDITFVAYVRDGFGGNLSFIRATFPVALVTSEAAAEEFIATTQAWCERIPILHGYGGFAVNQSPTDYQSGSGMLLQIAERFPGFEIDDSGGTVLVAHDHIKGVNWLTLLGPRFVERLGGAPALRDRLSAAIGLHLLPGGGVIVQAGRLPAYGDTAKGDELEPYREVARNLRPICLDRHPDLGTVEYGFGPEETQRWLRRLDS
jgi:hypothetical protein